MGCIGGDEKGFLLVGFIYKKTFDLSCLIDLFSKRFGAVLFYSPEWDFSVFTSYYEKEMGLNLKRRFILLDYLICPINLICIKTFSNELEAKFSDGSGRCVNIDPGFLSHNKLLLASTKNHYHRIYLGKGIYLELTMSFYRKQWRCFDWTYPDYKSYYRQWLKSIRGVLKERLSSYG